MSKAPADEHAHRILTFLAEARRRKVYVSVVAYVAVSLAVIELAEALVAALEINAPVTQVLTILLMLGFPVVVVLAWIFDLTTKGVVRTDATAPADGSHRGRNRSSTRDGRTDLNVPVHVPGATLPGVRARARANAAANDAASDVDDVVLLDPARVERAALGHLRHELRTPVTAIIGYAEMLLEDAADAAIEQDLKRIGAAGRELLRHIDRLLNAESVPAGEPRDVLAARVEAELRTPVTTVRGYAELLLETCRDNGRMELLPDLERIVAAARRALETSTGIAHSGTAPAALAADAAAMTREVLGRIRPVEPGSMAVDGEGRILVVDDNAMNRDLLLRQLARSGYIIDAAEDGVQALECIAHHDYDLILLDMLMPRMDGAETLRRIRADERLDEVPVIMLSSLDEVDTAIRCIEMGAEEYLSKPFQPVLLAARIAANVSLRRLRAGDRALRQQIATVHDSVQRLTRGVFPGDIVDRALRGETGVMHASPIVTVVACTLARPARPHVPAEFVALLDELVGVAAELVDTHGLGPVIVRPFGAVLVVGLPDPVEGHAVTATAIASELLQRVNGCAAGLHTGAVAGGIVDAGRPHYGVWGETVETAEALSDGAAPGTAALTPSTHALVRDLYSFTAGPVAEVAGHGHMRSWVMRAERVAAKV